MAQCAGLEPQLEEIAAQISPPQTAAWEDGTHTMHSGPYGISVMQYAMPAAITVPLAASPTGLRKRGGM